MPLGSPGLVGSPLSGGRSARREIALRSCSTLPLRVVLIPAPAIAACTDKANSHVTDRA